MGSRLELHNKLVADFPTLPIYYQPPSNISMSYPCIIYAKTDRDEKFADNFLYKSTNKYVVTIVDSDPDSSLLDNLSDYPLTSYDRRFVADDLYHDVFTIYF